MRFKLTTLFFNASVEFFMNSSDLTMYGVTIDITENISSSLSEDLLGLRVIEFVYLIFFIPHVYIKKIHRGKVWNPGRPAYSTTATLSPNK